MIEEGGFKLCWSRETTLKFTSVCFNKRVLCCRLIFLLLIICSYIWLLTILYFIVVMNSLGFLCWAYLDSPHLLNVWASSLSKEPPWTCCTLSFFSQDYLLYNKLFVSGLLSDSRFVFSVGDCASKILQTSCLLHWSHWYEPWLHLHHQFWDFSHSKNFLYWWIFNLEHRYKRQGSRLFWHYCTITFSRQNHVILFFSWKQ